MDGNEIRQLRGYAERVLTGTGIGLDDAEAVIAGGDTSAVAVALRAGWRCAADPVPALPAAPESEQGGAR